MIAPRWTRPTRSKVGAEAWGVDILVWGVGRCYCGSRSMGVAMMIARQADDWYWAWRAQAGEWGQHEGIAPDRASAEAAAVAAAHEIIRGAAEARLESPQHPPVGPARCAALGI